MSLRGERAWAKATVIKAPIRLTAGEGARLPGPLLGLIFLGVGTLAAAVTQFAVQSTAGQQSTAGPPEHDNKLDRTAAWADAGPGICHRWRH
ncbi:hypothetical protein, partial [Mesorhizobium sp.]|uniref:hypothetical protein n=1 Tax=Mesorhizobium sp. TaxID=1871066 RepID=UPI0025E6C352